MTKNKKSSNVKQVTVVVPTPRPQKPNRPRRKGRGSRGGNNAPVSTHVSVAPKNSERVHLKGTDRMLHVADMSGFGTGRVVVDLSVSASTFKRLRHMAEAYQRIRFKKLVFRVVTMCPTSASGGFATAFVADPTDVLGDGSDALDRVVAQTGSKIVKVWETATVSAKLSPDLLYTSQPPLGDQRLSSPGRLWIVAESKASVKTPLTVYCDWECEFLVPSLEGDVKGAGGVLVVQKPFYSRASHVGLWWSDDTAQRGDDPRYAIPGIEFNTTYQSKQKYYLSYSTAGSGNFDKFRMVADKTHGTTFAPVDPKGATIIEKTELNQWVFETGDVLTPLVENTDQGLEFLCQKSPSDTSQSVSTGRLVCSNPSSSQRLQSNPIGLFPQSMDLPGNFSKEDYIRAALAELQMESP